MSSQAISNNIHTPSSFSSLLFKNAQSKILAVFILVLTLILIVLTTLSLPSITPIWSPLIPLGVLIIAIVIFCILSKSSLVTKKEIERKDLVKKNTSIDKSPVSSESSTRQNSISSLLNENNDSISDISSFPGKNNQKRTYSDSSLDSVLSNTIYNSFSPNRKKSLSLSEDEDS